MFKKNNRIINEKNEATKDLVENANVSTTLTLRNNKINKIINITLCIIIFLIPLITLPRMLALKSYNIPKYVLLLICGLILLICIILKRKELKFDLIDKTLLAFFLLVVLSTIFGMNKYKAILGEMNRDEGMITLFIYFLVYYCAKKYFAYNKKLKLFAIITTSICTIIGILQYYNIFPLYYIFDIPFTPSFASSTFGNRNFFGSFLAIVLPLFMALYIIKKKKSFLVMSLLSFWALLISMTRSAWVGVGVAIIFGIIYIIKNYNKEIIKRTICIIVGFLVIFVFVLMPPPFVSNLTDYNQNKNSISGRFLLMAQDLSNVFGDSTEEEFEMSGAGRIGIWLLTLETIAQYPLLGTGPDTLLDGQISIIVRDPVNVDLNMRQLADKAHNEYLQIAATIGIPALIIYLAFVCQIVFKDKNIFKNNATFILLVPIISYLVQAFFNISTIGVAPIFWLLLGLIQNEEFKKNLSH